MEKLRVDTFDQLVEAFASLMAVEQGSEKLETILPMSTIPHPAGRDSGRKEDAGTRNSKMDNNDNNNNNNKSVSRRRGLGPTIANIIGEEKREEEVVKLRTEPPRGIGMKRVEEHFGTRPLRTKVYIPNYPRNNNNNTTTTITNSNYCNTRHRTTCCKTSKTTFPCTCTSAPTLATSSSPPSSSFGTTHPMFLVKLVIFMLWAISLTRATDTTTFPSPTSLSTTTNTTIRQDSIQVSTSSTPFSSFLTSSPVLPYSSSNVDANVNSLSPSTYPPTSQSPGTPQLDDQFSKSTLNSSLNLNSSRSKNDLSNPNLISKQDVNPHQSHNDISKAKTTETNLADQDGNLANPNSKLELESKSDLNHLTISELSGGLSENGEKIEEDEHAQHEHEQEEEDEHGDGDKEEDEDQNQVGRRSTTPRPRSKMDSRVGRGRRYAISGAGSFAAGFSPADNANSQAYGQKTSVSGSLRINQLALVNNDLDIPRKEEKKRFGDCSCWNSSDGVQREVECSCTNLPSSSFIGQDVHRITVENSANRTSDFTTLSNQNIRPYKNFLLELILNDLPLFQEIKDETFIGMQNLHTIYLVGAPNLTHISHGVFKGLLPKLKNIKIVHTGLEVAPMFNQLHTIRHLDSVDLENNKIAKIEPHWVENLKVDHLNLNYNNLRSIPPYAFKGATIARLTLKGNNHLTTLHPESFANIESLRQLDLSETQITQLPTHGLKTLEILRLEKVYTLTVIPSIYYFENLQEAAMTFPYHCCAFKYPETHDPQEYQRFKEFVSKVETENCGTTNSPNEDHELGVGDHVPIDSSTFLKRGKRNDGIHQLRIRSYSYSTTSPSISPTYSKYKPVELQFPRKSRRYPRHANLDSHEVELETETETDTSPSSNVDRFGYRKKSHHRSGASTSSAVGSSPTSSTGKNSPSEMDESSSGSLSAHNHSANHHHPIDGHDTFGVLKDTKDDFDPFVFDPDRTFGSRFENPDSDGPGSSWESGHDRHATDMDDFGTFHTDSVDEVEHVILLCGNVAVKKTPIVKCSPVPDAFSPCEDIMGNNWLRASVWFVVLFSLMGNITVLIVLFLTFSRMNVQRLLMANLAWSDFCMAIYLFMVAAQDLLSLGSYFNHAIDWQLGWGCQIAGFLTVFASELSVFTLTIITGERWYALTRAINLTKRLTIGGAAKLMALGWVLAFILALLPLVGVSSYSKTSICLPMEGTTLASQAYLVFLLIFNGLAFILVTVAYLKMYRAVAGHGGGAPAAHTADLAIAKKMALLVFTNFACWAPVAFFGLTAVSGHPLIGVTEAKILLVFFYPLNSLMNPFLYAILTKQFRKDFYMMLSRHGMCTELAAKHRGTVSTNNTVQTMQTTLRIGSMTDSTRHFGSGSGGRMSVSSTSGGAYFGPQGSNGPQDGHSPLTGKISFEGVATSPNANNRLDESSPTSNSNTNSNSSSSSSCFFRLFNGTKNPNNMNGKGGNHGHGSNGKSRRNNSKLMRDGRDSILDSDSDGDALYGDQRSSAETSFISVPLNASSPNNSSNSIADPISAGRLRRLKNYRIESRLPPISDDSETVALKSLTNV